MKGAGDWIKFVIIIVLSGITNTSNDDIVPISSTALKSNLHLPNDNVCSNSLVTT